MTVSELIGKVGALHLRNELSTEKTDAPEGAARYIIDCLTAEQTSAIAKGILNDSTLAGQVEIHLPAAFMAGHGLPDSVLTTKPATYYRNASCSKPALLLANTGDDEEQSLKEIIRIGSPELVDRPELWVRVAGEGLNLAPDHAKWWEKALSGLQELRLLSLDRFSTYVLSVRETIQTQGQPIILALGSALPALRLPKDSCYFNGVKEKVRGHASAWKSLYASAAKRRACYLLKQNPSQLLLSEDELMSAFEKVKESIPEAHHAVVHAFIHAPSGWNDEAAALAECEWENICPLFDGLRRQQFNLGQETLTFYDEREAELLNEEDREYLRLLIARSTTESREEDNLFYESHRNELKEDRKLKSAWDRFIFGKPRETEDFLAGVASCLESLFNQDTSGKSRRLKIRCDRATKKDLRELNVDAGLFFAKRYAGLKSLLGDRVSWNVGQLFDFPKLVAAWQSAPRSSLNRSVAKAAIQLKFVLELEVEQLSSSTQVYSTQMIWKFNPNAVSSEFTEDLSRLEEHPLVSCRAVRELVSGKGRCQTVDLANVKTFVPAYDKDRGSFVSVYKKQNDIAIAWRANLVGAREQGLLPASIADELEKQFNAFEASYAAAICGFSENGLLDPTIKQQLRDYASLLDTVCRRAKGDRNRELLLRPLLQVGTVTIDGGKPTAVVAPWHPLRLAALCRKAELVSGLIRHLLTAEQVFFGDTRLFFKDLAQDLAHAFYPEIVLGWQGNRPELLVLTDVAGDYSLHESPTANGYGLDDTNENPTEGSNCVIDLVQRYLQLHPHEQTNLSVVLYNCDSARLPQAVVDKISVLHEDVEDVRCQIILRHGDSGRLRDLYRDIVDASDGDADSFHASEATQDFMARLRIGILADQAPPPNPRDGCPYDIVFSQDVIARHATVEWYPESARPVPIDALVPARWSRRRPAAKDDMKSIVYLCCPVRSEEGWAFLTAVTTFLKGDWDENTDRRLLPARQLDFRDNITARIFEETHNLGNWVVNYDELLDRRQLLNQSVRVIRYKQSTTQGRNVVISSKAPLGLLRSMVLSRIKELNLGITEEDHRRLADRFIQDANDISGDIVLRAAKRGRNASELMGIVLSRYLVRQELGMERYYGWYFLDDYADWLGQKEQQIADILALSPEQTADGKLRLAVVITEAKYIDAAGLAAKRKESQKQLRDTVKRINEAVFGNPERLDRSLWLARLSDLILDGVQFPASAGINLADWRRAIREGECEIYIRGYSHVFVSGPADAADCSSFAEVAELEDSYQEVYGRAQVRELVLKYLRGEDPTSVREAVDPDKRLVWQKQTYRCPTDRKETVIMRRPPNEDGGSSVPPPSPGGPPPGNRPKEVEPAPSQAKETEMKPEAPQPTASWAYAGIQGLLSDSASQIDTEEERAWLKQIEQRTKGALQQFQLQSKLVQSLLTPNSALLKFAGSANLTVEQVLKRRSELLTTYGLNVISVQPEAGIVSLAIERPIRRIVQLPQVWAQWHPDSIAGNQELLIGVREDNGGQLFLSPSKLHAPHTLIAGSTGSGKSVLMQNIILGIAATNTPEQARILLIDPKQGVDYFQFDGLPHLQGGVIDQQDEALSRLESLVAEMDARYSKFRVTRVPNLSAFNQRVPAAERLPAIWLIHDEFAEWMLVEAYKDAVTSTVGRLGVKARAAGIYLVFAAQRPDATVMPMQLRANLGNRLILRVDSEGTSEIALGERGAERLLGRGHLLAKLEGAPGLCYAQVPFVEGKFMEEMVATIRKSSPR